jgi:CRISPR-associated endonuclease Cas1
MQTKEIMNCLGYGKYLGISKTKQAFVLFENGTFSKAIRFYRCGMILASDGNTISSSALFYAGIYNIPTMLVSQTGRVVNTMMPVSSGRNATRRLKQYEAFYNKKGVEICKALIRAKMENQIHLLEKYGQRTKAIENIIEDIDHIDGVKTDDVRKDLLLLESHSSNSYFYHYLRMFPRKLQGTREKHKASGILNNVLNFGYEFLKAECIMACYYSYLDPFMGFLHTPFQVKPALACDLEELYRWKIDEYVFDHKDEIGFDDTRDHEGRAFLGSESTSKLIKGLNELFDKKTRIKVAYGYHDHYKLRTIIKFQGHILTKYLHDTGELKII